MKDQDIEVVIMEQVLLGVSENMAVWLKERKPSSLEELGKLADDYSLARKSEGDRPGRSNAPGLIKEQAKKNPTNEPFRVPSCGEQDPGQLLW